MGQLLSVAVLVALGAVLGFLIRGTYLIAVDPIEGQARVTDVYLGEDGKVFWEYRLDEETCSGSTQAMIKDRSMVGTTIRVYHARENPCSFSSYPRPDTAFTDAVLPLVLLLAIGAATAVVLRVMAFARSLRRNTE